MTNQNTLLLLLLIFCSTSIFAEDKVVQCLTGKITSQYCKSMLIRYWKYNDLIERIGKEEGVDPALLKSLVAYESRYQHDAVSPKKATGLTQIMYSTAAQYNVRPHELYQPEISLRTGAKILFDLWQQYGRLDLTLAAYNAGPGAVQKAGNKIPNYRETKDYVVKVSSLYRRFKSRDFIQNKNTPIRAVKKENKKNIRPKKRTVHKYRQAYQSVTTG